MHISQPAARAQEVTAIPAPTSAPTAVATTSSTIDLTKLPLGDGHISTTTALNGYVLSCPSPGGPGAPGLGGAEKNGPWLDSAGGTWDSTAKISVSGAVKWPNAQFSIRTAGTNRVLSGNGLPVNVTTGVFPVQRTDPAAQYDPNPNSIQAQNFTLTLPLNPAVSANPGCASMGVIGVMINGVALYSALDAENRDAVAHEIQDSCSGHPDISGQYHYHSFSPCLDDTPTDPTVKSDLIGYALDGFGIYGFKNPDGSVYTNADLDECHGLTSEILWDGQKVVMYHYQVTHEYPYTLGCFHATPVQPPRPNGPGGTGGPGGNGGNPPSRP